MPGQISIGPLHIDTSTELQPHSVQESNDKVQMIETILSADWENQPGPDLSPP